MAVAQGTDGTDPFPAAHEEAAAKNRKGLRFTIRLAYGRTKFQQGEIIRVELSFSSALPKTYRLDGATYDCGGRLDIDTYNIDAKRALQIL